MIAESGLRRAERLSYRFKIAAFGSLVVACALLLVALAVPIAPDVAMSKTVDNTQSKPMPLERRDLEPLLARMAGVRFIRPTQVQAAVKDSGAAKQLAKKLKLQGVVEMGETLVAYIQVDKQGVKTVRKGDAVLDFIVEGIQSGKVTLSLQGVEVVLQH